MLFLSKQRVTHISKWDDGEVIEDLTEEEIAEYSESDFYEKLASSIAPEVFGHEDVKKSLLLQLVRLHSMLIVHISCMH